MRISDVVANRILELMDAHGGIAEIQRNELAAMIGCVPSQINYVITSRFTPEQGYVVESRRGGGGYIKIRRVLAGRSHVLMHVINAVGGTLDFGSAAAILKDLAYQELITMEAAHLILAAVDDKTLGAVPADKREALRADLFKKMLLTTM